jgi:hypothetical protein
MALASGLSLQAVGFSAKGWPPWLGALVATALLGSEAEKLTLGEEIIVRVPHFVVTLTEYKGHYWLTNARIIRYQICSVKIHK